MFIVGISGKIGTGKSELARLASEYLGKGWGRRSFADALKLEVAGTFNIPLKDCYDVNSKNRPVITSHALTMFNPPKALMTVREIMQWWGTDVRRAQNPAVWVHAMAKWVDDNMYNYKGVIIDDVRFPDEFGLVKGMGGVAVRLNPYPGQWDRQHVGRHVSETALDHVSEWDLIFSPKFGELASGYVEQIKDKLIEKQKLRKE